MRRLMLVPIIIAWTFLGAVEEITTENVQSILPQLDAFVSQGMKDSNVPGVALAIIHKGDAIYLKGYGFRNLEEQLPVTNQTVFQLASVSKPIASTVIAALVSQGKVDWDEAIDNLDPKFRLSDSWVSAHLTIRDLLSHRSGLPDHAGDILEDLSYPLDEILFRLRYIKPLGAFREDYAYTNFGFSEAAYACSRFLGVDWSDLAKQILYEPLGMTATSSSFADYVNHNDRAMTYQIRGNKVHLLNPPREPDAQSPAGGVSSSITDLAKWVALQLGSSDGQKIVAKEALLATHTPAIVTGVNEKTGQPSFYAMGWDVSFNESGRRFLKHSGAFNLGVRSQVVLLPDEELGIVIVANASPTGLPEAISKTFYDLLFEGSVEEGIVEKYNALWMEHQVDPIVRFEKPDDFTPSLPFEKYIGTYSNDYYGDMLIRKNEGALELVIGPEDRVFPLRHLNRDVFAFETEGENAIGETQVIFTFDENEDVRSVTVDYFNRFGMGIFQSEDLQ